MRASPTLLGCCAAIGVLAGGLGARPALKTPGPGDETVSYADGIRKWQKDREERLRADNGWLTLVGRYPLKAGANTFGTGKGNDVTFPAALEGTGPGRLGSLRVDAEAKTVTLRLADGVAMTSGGKAFTGERALGTSAETRDWVGLGRLSMHVVARNGAYVLRLADNESPVRKNFPGCVWYPPDEAYKVEAKFVPHPAGKTLAVANVVDEVSDQPCPGYAEFELGGRVHKLDAIREGAGLFFVFRDATAGDTTYQPGRFLDVAATPKPNATFTLDFNTAYNPPCAFSEFTTCPLPPKQNVMGVRVEAGEKSPAKPR